MPQFFHVFPENGKSPAQKKPCPFPTCGTSQKKTHPVSKPGISPADAEKHHAEAVGQDWQHCKIGSPRLHSGLQEGEYSPDGTTRRRAQQQLCRGLSRRYPRSRFSHPPTGAFR